jgi:hypothetical protein
MGYKITLYNKINGLEHFYQVTLRLHEVTKLEKCLLSTFLEVTNPTRGNFF